jgi:hypothetical protein
MLELLFNKQNVIVLTAFCPFRDKFYFRGVMINLINFLVP